MKQTNAFVKGIAALVCAVILLGAGTLPAKAAMISIKHVWITFDSAFAVGSEIPYTYSITTEPETENKVAGDPDPGLSPDDESFYRNGIIWWDLTEGTALDPYQTNYFREGHRYQIELYLESTSKWSVDFGVEERFEATVTINGNSADTGVKSWAYIDRRVLSVWARLEFTAVGKVSRVELPGIPVAAAGEAPSFRKTGAVHYSNDEWYMD